MQSTTSSAASPAIAPAATPSISLPRAPHARGKGRKNRPSPRSYKIGSQGGRTSLRLENEFQTALRDICRSEGVTMSRFLSDLRDRLPDEANFSSRVRCAVLLWFKERVTLPPGKPGSKR
jgi:predicted DNA-binding ribbon-helix-helix protein